MPVHCDMVCQHETGWPILKQAAWPILKWAGPFQNKLPGTACFKTGQIKIYLLIGLNSFKMGQILNRAVTYIAAYIAVSTLLKLLCCFNKK